MMAMEDKDAPREDMADARDALDAKEAVDCKSGAFGRQDVVDGHDEAVGSAEEVAGAGGCAVVRVAGTGAFALRFDKADFLLVVSLRVSARRPAYGLS